MFKDVQSFVDVLSSFVKTVYDVYDNLVLYVYIARMCITCFSHYHILLGLLQFKWILTNLIPL